jgi:hypothetical protein
MVRNNAKQILEEIQKSRTAYDDQQVNLGKRKQSEQNGVNDFEVSYKI